jgi:biopolymer transport protein ExbD
MATLASAPEKGKFKRTRTALHIDMTPMVDLAFLLLTFFIMTTTLMKHSVMEIKQPVPDTADRHTEVKPEHVLNLILAKDNKVYWYMGNPGTEASVTDYSSSGVRQLLNKKNAEIKELYVFIKASDESRYQNMVDVLDEVIIANINKYALLNLEAEDKKLIN